MNKSSDKVAQSGRGSTVGRIEAALLEDISVGVLAPGTRLDEVKLTERFGVSRTPVREALTRLTAQGILVPGEKRGVQVAEYSREELAQIFESMYEIEAACVRIASQRLTLLSRADIENAQAACVAAAEKGELVEYLRANEGFHSAIYRATGNPYMAQVASDFRRRTGPFRAKKFASNADMVASAQSHCDLINDIFSEDSRAASEGMRAHMTASFMQALAAN
jgi:DNA-binding GntR family transcriptional regulator